MKKFLLEKIKSSDSWVLKAAYVLFTNKCTLSSDTEMFKRLIEYYQIHLENTDVQISMMRRKIINHYIDELMRVTH